MQKVEVYAEVIVAGNIILLVHTGACELAEPL